jgi:flavin reductase (DIM6/NTAB) family NADH-FMN oxidoreductase RutF
MQRLHRCIQHPAATCSKRWLQQATDSNSTILIDELRSLLRRAAQPVTVVTVGEQKSLSDSKASTSLQSLHGATLSSFASVAFDPIQIVAFSLRYPSRMVDRLNLTPEVEFGVNILAEGQADIATAFARPDLFNKPFDTASHHLDPRGIPILENCVGTLICSVLQSYPLDRCGRSTKPFVGTTSGETQSQEATSKQPWFSHLFLVRVKEVHANTDLPLPLVYHNGEYTTISYTRAS